MKKVAAKTKRYRIAHIHVWDKNNKGDYAIVLAVQELLLKKFPGAVINNFPVEVLKNYNQAQVAKLNQADFIVIGGGGIFYSYFLPFSQEMTAAIKKPIFLFGLGYIKEVDAPLWSSDKTASVIALASKAAGVGVRDLNTKRFLTAGGIKPAAIKIIGDPAVLLSENKPAAAVMKKMELPNRKLKIGLNLNYSGWLGFGKWREDILRAYRETAEYFQQELSAEIYYLKHHPGEENIYPELKIKNLKIVDLKPGEQKYIYGKLDLIIGMMLHVGVMSFGALTPEISVAYDIRNYGFAEFIGHPELVVDLNKLKSGELRKRAQIVFKKRKSYQSKFRQRRQKISDNFNGYLKFIKNNL
ncbi:MAG: polysaccharide pyruvyl transferase family protein [Candidatus Falkowbacteria bacterium]|nr:MAG: polysaccharide pyruvyl transferase family protein [Candidatus Falkowbacteria bacterium]